MSGPPVTATLLEPGTPLDGPAGRGSSISPAAGGGRAADGGGARRAGA
jgi:hypothetical protein